MKTSTKSSIEILSHSAVLLPTPQHRPMPGCSPTLPPAELGHTGSGLCVPLPPSGPSLSECSLASRRRAEPSEVTSARAHLSQPQAFPRRIPEQSGFLPLSLSCFLTVAAPFPPQRLRGGTKHPKNRQGKAPQGVTMLHVNNVTVTEAVRTV